MSTIKRYTISLVRGPGYSEMCENLDEKGWYVTYTDHLAAVEAAVMAERAECAAICDKLSKRSMALQSGSPDALTNIMLRQVAVLGHEECADSIRARTTNQAKEAE